MFPFEISNPGIGTVEQLTPAEEAFLTNLANLAYVTGDMLYYDGANLNRLPIGSAGEVLTVVGGLPNWEPATGITLYTPTGSVNSSNTAFVFSTEPKVIVSDGVTMRKNFGWTWTGGTSTATMDIAPSFDLFGIA